MFTQRPEIKELNRLYRAVDEVYHEVAVKLGLSDSAFSVLYALAELGDGCTQKEIAALFSMSKQTIHSSVKGLAGKGCLTLAPGPGRDRRILLTPAGRRLLEEKIAPVIALENRAVEGLSPQERQTLLALTRKYAESHIRTLNTL